MSERDRGRRPPAASPWVPDPHRPLRETVAPGLRLLVSGLNPSWHAVRAGVGFAGPGNRFWPMLRLVLGDPDLPADPDLLRDRHGIGMTDLVARPTPRAADLRPEEYREGLSRLSAMCSALAPGAVCMVGLAGWRAAVDSGATAGWQAVRLSGVPVYLMPSTSGLNAGTRLDDLVAHAGAALGKVPHMGRRDTYLDHLGSIPMFSACNRKELLEVGRRTEEVTVSAGDRVVKEGRRGREFFLIVDGKAEVSRNGRKITTLGPGDHFGELALFEQVPRNADVEALTDLDVVVLDRRDFAGLLQEVPTIGFKLLKGMAARLREADTRALH